MSLTFSTEINFTWSPSLLYWDASHRWCNGWRTSPEYCRSWVRAPIGSKQRLLNWYMLPLR